MRLLLDTHLLLWASIEPERLSRETRRLIDDREHMLLFSAISIWEVAIKQSRRRPGFDSDPGLLRRSLRENGFAELMLTSIHAAAVLDLPPIHKDPFDRILIAQATVEDITLLTSDAIMARYPGPVKRV